MGSPEDLYYPAGSDDPFLMDYAHWSEPTPSSFWSELHGCSRSVLEQSVGRILLTFALCLSCSLLRILLLNTSRFKGALNAAPVLLSHTSSIVAGLVLVHYFFDEYFLLLAFISVIAVVFLIAPTFVSARGCLHAVCGVSVVTFLFGEFHMEPTRFHQVRGSIMIAIMKSISLAHDLSTVTTVRSVQHEQPKSPNPSPLCLAFGRLAYLLCPASVVFGPWGSFSQFEQLTDQRGDYVTRKKFSVQQLLSSVVRAFGTLVFAFGYLLWSTCVSQLLLPDPESHRWLYAYLASQSFRFSHYFVSYASEAFVTAFELDSSRTDTKAMSSGFIHRQTPVTRMSHVEFPRSLVDVVVSWNLPMHTWLKQYVYKQIRPFGHARAVLATYVASSLLHGLNFQLSAVLLSIGVFAYIEYLLREKLARIFDACISSRPCPTHCGHQNKCNFWVRCLNFGFACLTIFHLAYLAVMFDTNPEQMQGYSMKHALSKWSDLGFVSHYIALGTYTFYYLIS